MGSPREELSAVATFSHCAFNAGLQQIQLLSQRAFAFERSDIQQVFQCRAQATCNLRRARTGHSDFIERKVDIVLPGHRRRHQANFPSLVPVSTIGKGARCELTQAIMQPVDCLYRRRRIEERSVGQGPLGNINEQSQTIGHILIKGPLKAEFDRLYRGVHVETVGRARDLKERGTCWHKLAQCWPERQDAVARLGNPN